MPKTLFDNVWVAHIVSPERDSAPAVLYVVLHLIHEVTSPQAFAELDAGGLRPRRAELTKATLDHSTPTLPAEADGRQPYVSAEPEAQVAALPRNSAQHGIAHFTYYTGQHNGQKHHKSKQDNAVQTEADAHYLKKKKTRT